MLGYRDSYLLFNKNRSLCKIIATQAEKEDLIHQEILPFSYRSRQIALVTARSIFRQFGSRGIVNGRRVRDDYWEGNARRQGCTEEDLTGEISSSSKAQKMDWIPTSAFPIRPFSPVERLDLLFVTQNLARDQIVGPSGTAGLVKVKDESRI